MDFIARGRVVGAFAAIDDDGPGVGDKSFGGGDALERSERRPRFGNDEVVDLACVEDVVGFQVEAAAVVGLGPVGSTGRRWIGVYLVLAVVCGACGYVAQAATLALWRGEVGILRHISPVW